MEFVDALCHLPLVRRYTQVVGYTNAANYQHLAVFFDLTHRVRSEASLCGRNPTRLQRASKCASQSASRGSHQVVQRSCVGFVYLEVYPVVFSYL